jgi:phage terminase large subunit-like protein
MITLPASTLGPAVAEFFAGNLVFCEGDKKGEPFILEDFQRQIIDLVYELDSQGRRAWKMVIIGIPRGNGKSPFCAGIGLFELAYRDDSPQIFCTAAARGQAGIVHKFAYEMSQDGPLADYFEYPRTQRGLGPIRCESNDGVFKVLSADGLLQHGQNPSVVIEDELHAFTTGKQKQLHFAMTSSMHKRHDSVMIVITTAGENKDSLLGELYDSLIKRCTLEHSEDGCLTVGRDYKSRELLIWYGAPEDADVRDPKVWRACTPAPWIEDDALELAAHENPESVFRQLYLNQWVLGADAAIQPGAWDACKVEGSIAKGTDIWVGVDIGEKHDRSAIVWVAPDDCGRLRVESTIIVPPANAAGIVTTLPQVEAELRRLADTYSLMKVNYDPWSMRDLANRMASENMPMHEYAQNDINMVPACGSVYDMVNDKQIVHDGDIDLREHVLNAAVKRCSRGGWRFTKPPTSGGTQMDRSKKIDACIAMVMAVDGYQTDHKEVGEVWAASW